MPTITHGMLNAMKPAEEDSAMKCNNCLLNVPVYPGKYPSTCPNCNEPFAPEEEDCECDNCDSDECENCPCNSEEGADEFDESEIMQLDHMLYENAFGKLTLEEIMGRLLD